MSYNLGTASGRIDLDYTGAAAVRRAKTDVAGLSKYLSAAGISGATAGKMAALGFGGVLVAGLAVATKSAATFEKQLSGIEAVSGASAKEMEALRAKALQLGADTAFSASESAQAMEELVKAGLSVDDVLNGAADAAVALAAAGGIGIPEAATIASNALNQFNLTAQELPGVVDDIAGAANASAIDVGDLGMSLTQVGAVANLAGMNFKDTATAIALMGNAGIKGSDAGTSLKTMLQNLQPVTDKQIDLFRELGILTEDGSNAFFDAKGNVKSYAEVSEVLSKALEGKTKAEKLATLETMFGTDAIRAAAVAADAGAEGVNKLTEEMSKMTAAEVAAKRMDNLAGSLEELGGSIETAMIMGGSAFLGVLKAIVDSMTQGVNAATDFASSVADKAGPGLDALGGTVLNVISILQNLWDIFDGGGASIAGLGLDALIGVFNILAQVLETVSGALVGQEELIVMVGAAWLIMANGGLARVIAQMGWLAALMAVKVLGALGVVTAGAATTAGALSALAAKAAAAAAAFAVVATLGSVIFAWKGYKDAVQETQDVLASTEKAIKSDSIPALLEQKSAIAELRGEYESLRLDPESSMLGAFTEAVGQAGGALLTLDFESLGRQMNISEGLESTSAAADAVTGKINSLSLSTISLAHNLGDIDRDKMISLLEGLETYDPATMGIIDDFLVKYQGQLSQIGLTIEDVEKAWASGDHGMSGITAGLEALRTDFGRTKIASDQAKGAIAEFGDSTKSTAEAADELKAALDSLIGVELSADQATINWHQGLAELRKQIKGTNGALRGNSAAALSNRQAIINSASSLMERVDAEARAGASAKQLAALIKNGRKALIDNAVAAGANRKVMEKLISTYNLTPKQIRTLVEAAGADSERHKMDLLINKYKLTPKEVKSVIEAVGATTAAEQVQALRNHIDSLNDKTITITTKMNRVVTTNGYGIQEADGGIVQSYARGGLRRRTDPGVYNAERIKFAEQETGGEAFIPLSLNKRYRSEAILAHVASIFGGQFVKMASGGFANLSRGISASKSMSTGDVAVQVNVPSPVRSSQGGLRMVKGELTLAASGRAFITGVAMDADDDDYDYDDTLSRMGPRR